jgi:hypothetical protein
MGKVGAKWAVAATIGAALLFPCASQATVTIGSNLGRAPNNTAVPNLTGINSALPASYLAPGGLTSPVNGTVTAWRMRAGTGGSTAFEVIRPATGDQFTGIAVTPVVVVPATATTAFPLQLPIKIGDSIATTNDGSYGGLQFTRNDAAASFKFWTPTLGVGQTRSPSGTQAFELTFQADINPTNAFTLGSTTRNKKKGTATLTVNLPNPGELTASGKGAKASGVAVISKSVTAPGAATLLIKAKGNKKATLSQTGKVKLSLNVTFTPTGGNPSSVATKVKLKKNI